MHTDCDEEILRKVRIFCQVVLNPDFYCFKFVSETQFATPYVIFKENYLRVFDHSFRILYDVNTVQQRVTTDAPQRYGNIAISGKTDGVEPNKIEPSFLTSDGHHAVRSAAFNDSVRCQDKLKTPNHNSAVCPGEGPVELYCMILLVLSPVDGTVLDLKSGPPRSSLDYLKTGWLSVCIKSNEPSVQYGLGIVRIHAVPEAATK